MAFSISTKKLGKAVLGAGLLFSMIAVPYGTANSQPMLPKQMRPAILRW